MLPHLWEPQEPLLAFCYDWGCCHTSGSLRSLSWPSATTGDAATPLGASGASPGLLLRLGMLPHLWEPQEPLLAFCYDWGCCHTSGSLRGLSWPSATTGDAATPLGASGASPGLLLRLGILPHLWEPQGPLLAFCYDWGCCHTSGSLRGLSWSSATTGDTATPLGASGASPGLLLRLGMLPHLWEPQELLLAFCYTDEMLSFMSSVSVTCQQSWSTGTSVTKYQGMIYLHIH